MTATSQVLIKDPVHAYGHAVAYGVRLPKSEPYILKNPIVAQWYADDVLKHPWTENTLYENTRTYT